MGKGPRERPECLANKLLTVRQGLELSQSRLIKALGFQGRLGNQQISAYELGQREPPLRVLLSYARLAGVYADVLIDDDLDLPEKLPASPKSEGIPHKPGPKPRSPKRS
ncbi:MAG: helix-turn-helix domain-containing protein [Blastocatellia bacterium]